MSAPTLPLARLALETLTRDAMVLDLALLTLDSVEPAQCACHTFARAAALADDSFGSPASRLLIAWSARARHYCDRHEKL